MIYVEVCYLILNVFSVFFSLWKVQPAAIQTFELKSSTFILQLQIPYASSVSLPEFSVLKINKRCVKTWSLLS